mmetsp:Transcript_13374/g.38503  ORF Transcript_13374/g.38503 Transcript_13374/m.38503 type:complete len:282 (+) Transcript_13374:160-1005(+)
MLFTLPNVLICTTHGLSLLVSSTMIRQPSLILASSSSWSIAEQPPASGVSPKPSQVGMMRPAPPREVCFPGMSALKMSWQKRDSALSPMQDSAESQLTGPVASGGIARPRVKKKPGLTVGASGSYTENWSCGGGLSESMCAARVSFNPVVVFQKLSISPFDKRAPMHPSIIIRRHSSMAPPNPLPVKLHLLSCNNCSPLLWAMSIANWKSSLQPDVARSPVPRPCLREILHTKSTKSGQVHEARWPWGGGSSSPMASNVVRLNCRRRRSTINGIAIQLPSN